MRGQLLVLNLGAGWVALCAFLGRSVPQVPFTHAHQALAAPADTPARPSLLRRLARIAIRRRTSGDS